jgi:hypothetical protein
LLVVALLLMLWVAVLVVGCGIGSVWYDDGFYDVRVCPKETYVSFV